MRRLLFILALAVPLAAQTGINWGTGSQPKTSPWPANGGFQSSFNAYDPASGDIVFLTQNAFSGTVSVTSGSPTVTWVSGSKFSAVWLAATGSGGGVIRINGTQVHLLSGTTPTNCTAGVPISCTTMTLSSNFGSTGTFAYTATANSIYGGTPTFYNVGANTFTYGPSFGELAPICLVPENGYPGYPQGRQALKWAVDTKRNRLYMAGGVNECLKYGVVTSNGASTNATITISAANANANQWFFSQTLVGSTPVTIQIPQNTGPKFTITAWNSELSIDILCGGGNPACPASGNYTATVNTPEMPTAQNGMFDLWYLTLNANPLNDTWTEVSPTGVTYSGEINETNWAYDSDDDGFVAWGDPLSSTTVAVFCSADSPGSGTLTAAQTAMGCAASNVMNTVTTTGTQPTANYSPSILYDTSRHMYWDWGGGNQSNVWQTDVWGYCPSNVGLSCGTAKKWTQMNTTSQPPASAFVHYVGEMVLDSNTNNIVAHIPDIPADYVISPGASAAWSTLTTTGTGIPQCVSGSGNLCGSGGIITAFHPPSNTIIGMQMTDTYVTGSATSAMLLWQATLTGGGGPTVNIPLTVQEALYPGDNTGHLYATAGGISRTNDYWCNGVPIADSTGLTVLTSLGITGAIAGQFRTLETWPSGNIRNIEVCGVIASYTAGTPQTPTLVNSGSGNFGTPASMTSGTSTITINTTGGTCGSGSAICFTMLSGANFDGIDTAKIGSTTLVATGTSTGFQVTGPAFSATDCGSATPCTTAYTSKNDSASTCSVEKDGPVEAVVLCNGSLKDGSANVYMTYTARFYFHNSSSKVKIVSTLKNAAYGTSNTFATAWKGMEAWEFRMGSNLGSSLSWNIGNHTGVGSPTTGTMTGTDSVFIYQGQNTTFGDPTWSTCTSPCNAYTTDAGYTIKKNGSAVQTGTNAQAPVGYAYLANSSGNYIETGSFFFAGLGPRSLEFQGGGTGTDAIRIGLMSAQNTFSTHLAWPQWRTDEFYVDFGATAPANIPNVFLAQQHSLIANPSLSQWNASGVLTYPLDTAADEDQYYYNTVFNASPSITTTNGCAGGTSYLTLGCIYDVGTQTVPQWAMMIYPLGYTWEQGGGRDQIEWRESYLYNWITRGHTGRYLQVKLFEMMQQDVWQSHTDGTYTWRSKPSAQLDTTGRPTATSSNPTGTCNTNGTTTVTSASGAFFEPWYHSTSGGETINIGGSNYSVASVQSPTSLTTLSSVPTATGATCTYTSLSQASLRTWSFAAGSGIDNAHSHVTGAFRWYEISGDENQRASIRDTFDDYLLNLNTNQASATPQTAVNGTGGTSGTILTISTGGPLPAYVTVGYPILIGSTVSNYAAYTITNIAGSTITIAPSAPTISSPNANWIVLGGTLSQRAAGLSMTNGSKYSDFLTATGDSSDAVTALQLAENVYYMGVKPPLCASGYPAGCSMLNKYGGYHIGPWQTQGTSFTRGLMFQSHDTGVNDASCLPLGPATAQGGTTNTITLASSASAADSFYNGIAVNITGGTGSGQGKTIISYVGSTRVATVISNWSTIPDSTSTYTMVGNDDQRASSPFQQDILEEGLWDLRRVAGSSWADYTTAFDLIEGGVLWSLSEGSNFDGTGAWTNNGYRYYVVTDSANCPSDATFYPVRANQSLWNHHLFWNYYNGANPTAQQNFLTQSIQHFMSPLSVGIGLTGQSIDVGAYQLNSLLYQLHNGSSATLQTLPITVTNNGGGNYTLHYTTLAGTSYTRAKWSTQTLVDWNGFDPANNVFNTAVCAVSGPLSNPQLGLTNCGSPTTSAPWFASTEVNATNTGANMPAPVIGAQTVSVTIPSSVPGYTAFTLTNFMVKAMTTSNVPPSGGTITITSPTPTITISGVYQLVAALSGLPTTYTVKFLWNGIDDPEHLACLSRQGMQAALGTCDWNTYWTFGGPYETLTAVALDVNNITLATSAPVAFTIANALPVPASVFSWTISAPAGPWSGTVTVTPTYTGTDSTHGSMTCFVDGQSVTGTIDTTLFNDGTHDVRCNGKDSNAPLAATGTNWQTAAEWEPNGGVVFANNGAPMDVRFQPSYEIQLCLNPTAVCPASLPVSLRVYNTDETFTAGTISTTPTITTSGWTNYPTAPVTISSCTNCSSVTLTAQVVGTVPILFTEAGTGKTRTLYANVDNDDTAPNLGSDGNVYTTYTVGKTILSTALMISSGDYFTDGVQQPDWRTPGYFYPAASSMAKDMYNSFGYGATAEFATGTPASGSWSGTSGNWATPSTGKVAVNLAANQSHFNGYPLFANYTFDSWLGSGCEQALTGYFGTWGGGGCAGQSGSNPSWSPTAIQTVLAQLVAQGNVLSLPWVDEVTSGYGAVPGGTIDWSTYGGLVSLSCVNGGVCTITCSAHPQSAGLPLNSGCPTTAGHKLIVTGSGDPNLDYNTTSGTPALYTLTITTPDPNGGGYAVSTFPTPAGVGTASYTAMANPGLTINWLVNNTFDVSGNSCQGSSSGPCPDFVQNTFFRTISNYLFSATGGTTKMPLSLWTVGGSANSVAWQNWECDPAIASGAMVYYPGNQNTYTPRGTSLSNFSTLAGDVGVAFHYRHVRAGLACGRTMPMIGEGFGVPNDYGFQAQQQIPITSIVGNLVTFSQAPSPLILNISPEDTRMWVLGNSNGGANTNFYITDCPVMGPSTWQCHIVYQNWTFTAHPVSGPYTATRLDGNTFTLNSISTTSGGNGGIFGPNDGTSSCTTSNNSSNYFHVAGTGTTLDTTLMYLYPLPAAAPCTELYGARGRTAQAPNFSSATGGTGYIVMNESYVRGGNIMARESELGNAAPFFVYSFHMLQAVAQNRLYYGNVHQSAGAGGGFNATFNDTNAQTFQAATHPRYKFDEAQGNWLANSTGAKFWGRFAPLVYQPRGSSPDLGRFFETTLRLSSTGNMIGWASLAHGSLTRTIDLTPIVIGGHPTIKYCAASNGWITIAAILAPGVTSDTLVTNPVSCQSGTYVATPTTWVSEPVIGLNLAACPTGTASISYQVFYNPLQTFTPEIDNRALFETFSLGSGTAASLPIDPGISAYQAIRPVCVLPMAAAVVGDLQQLQ